MQQASLLVIVLCLTACSMTSAPDEFGRVPVEVRLVRSLPSIAGERIVGRVVSPSVIQVVSGFEANVGVIAHELVHVIQWHRIGPSFPIVYVAQVIAHGYWDAPLEVEARALATTDFYVSWARDVIAHGHAGAPLMAPLPPTACGENGVPHVTVTCAASPRHVDALGGR